jgi:hypothetical protein
MTKILDALQASEERVMRFVNEELAAIGELVREELIIPFCDEMDCDFQSNNGHWVFLLNYPCPGTHGRLWEVGDARRPLPGNPGGLEGDMDKWWAAITNKECQLKDMLNSSPEWGHGSIAWHVRSYHRPKT